jgi:starch synthase (maltosyl-transferring)
MPDSSVDERRRVVIEHVRPQIDDGRFPVKRVVGDIVIVEAAVFADGHDQVACRVLHWRQNSSDPHASSMKPLGNDLWRGEFSVSAVGRYQYTVEGWMDRFLTWRGDLGKRIAAGQDTRIDLLAGSSLIDESASRAAAVGNHAKTLRAWSERLRRAQTEECARAVSTDDELLELMQQYPDWSSATRYHKQLDVVVDREKARFSSWYEMFPRSCSTQPGRHGTLRDCEARLPYVASMGFDVVYLPPIHPIGNTFRKGKNNTSPASPDDVGSPWAIGSSKGGHTAIHPQLGTIQDFEHFRRKAKDHGLEVALDIAFQCSPDHPYVQQHREWFRSRPDGSVQYAENPPKKYEDIYPLDFETKDWRALWAELKSVFLFWVDHGVRIFRVDNPHTKPFPFWEWIINEIKAEHPDVLFLAEAFTRPHVMYRLAKLGFSQSYTYFTWRNTKQELTDYFAELTQTEVREYFRPNLWPNTPDILHEFLQTGGRAAFMIRLILAATLGSNYGIYGPAFELCENAPLRQGSEEYLDSEKFEIKHRDLNAAWSLKDLISRINAIRQQNPALQRNHTLHFHDTDNPLLLCYSKTTEDLSDVVLVVVNLDPFHPQTGWVHLDLASMGLDEVHDFQANDLLGEGRYLWRGPSSYVELTPETLPAHIFSIRRWVRTERDFDYYL